MSKIKALGRVSKNIVRSVAILYGQWAMGMVNAYYTHVNAIVTIRGIKCTYLIYCTVIVQKYSQVYAHIW
ncbi:MAG: hypothetical protein GY820_20215 [Gammaproteobacteria bacterium]|nr:hypothetical protein [Gammaproteobacteria bacterium]